MGHVIENVLMEVVGFSSREISDCLTWAFGDNYAHQMNADLRGTWNSRHGQLFQIRASDSVEEITATIGKIYKKLFTED